MPYMDGMDVFFCFIWWFCSDFFDLYLPILGEGFIPSLASTQLENRGRTHILKRFDYSFQGPLTFGVPGMSCFFQISLKGSKVKSIKSHIPTSYLYVEDYCNTKAFDILIDCSQMWADTVHIENPILICIYIYMSQIKGTLYNHKLVVVTIVTSHTSFFQLKKWFTMFTPITCTR